MNNLLRCIVICIMLFPYPCFASVVSNPPPSREELSKYRRITTMKEYQYDRYHNVTTYVNYGDSALETDNLAAKIKYDTKDIATNNLVSNSKTLTVYRDTSWSDKVYRIDATYNAKGLVTRTDQIDLTSSNGKSVITSYWYNQHGLLSKVTLPATDSMGTKQAFTKIEYDP